MLWSKRTSARRAEIRKRIADSAQPRQAAASEGRLASIVIGSCFFLIVTCILMLRDQVAPYRPGQYVPQDILARVEFKFADKQALVQEKQAARARVFRVYKADFEMWPAVEARLKELPDRLSGFSFDDVPDAYKKLFKLETESIKTQLDSAALTALNRYHSTLRRKDFDDAVHGYVEALRPLVVLSEQDRREEIKRQGDQYRVTPQVEIDGVGSIDLGRTLPLAADDSLVSELRKEAIKKFGEELQLKIVAFTFNVLHPTHVLDEAATAEKQNEAAANVPLSKAMVSYHQNQPLKTRGDKISDRDWQVLKAEHEAFLASLPFNTWLKSRMGMAGIVGLITLALGAYIYKYQPRVMRNHVRAVAIAALLITMLFIAQLAGMGTGPLFVFGTAPTILVAMILAVAYDRRFAMGVSTVHAILVTVAVDQTVGFFLVLFTGILTACFLLDEIRTRSKLIEVGGATALAMMLATLATGMSSLHPIEPIGFTWRNCLYAGAAGLGVGFFVLGILPGIEKLLRITTSMTLLELADMSQPLLRRLAVEAPGTYSHSLQVAALSEAAADVIGANSLLCRVGSYYHDVGKINKAEYFCENQVDGVNRHINLTPSVSLLIIIGHVKDGVELAKEYNLPTSLFPFIQQHHGTTLVEYFYHQACVKDKAEHEEPSVSETQYRYPGPKPRTKDTAIVMLADAVESATRAIGEWTAGRIETLVRDLAIKRLMDGQFDECDLTMRELDLIQRSMVKSLVGIYHGRITYPSTARLLAIPAVTSSTGTAAAQSA